MFKQLRLPFTKSNTAKHGSDSSEEYDPDEDGDRNQPCSQWTRVKSVYAWKPSTVTVFDIEKDIQSDLATGRARQHM